MERVFRVVMVLGVLISGCAAYTINKAYWIKDGKEVSSEEIQKDYRECRGPDWIKDGTTDEELEKTLTFA